MPPATLPVPSSSLVISYSYLWEAEYRTGREEGTKDRPCAVVLAVREEDGDFVVTVAPITHAAPRDPSDAIELSRASERSLGLDDARSWIVCTELNRFVSPGPDLHPSSRSRPGQFVYGSLPRATLTDVLQRLTELRARRRPHVVDRDG